MNKIAIFCSASDQIEPKFAEKAAELGKWMGEQHKWLIYGGSNTGLMEATAKAVKAHGGSLLGVIPSILEEKGRASDMLDVTIRAVNLSDRKDIMLQEAEVMVALPGGVGTLDEIFHVMASASVGYHEKKVIFYNVDGFWNGILQFLNGLEAQHFAHRPLSNFYSVANSLDELTDMIQ